MDNKEANYHALWFIREDLNHEKAALLDSMRDMSLSYSGHDPDFIVAWKEEFTRRIEEINSILYNVNMGVYSAPEECDDEV